MLAFPANLAYPESKAHDDSDDSQAHESLVPKIVVHPSLPMLAVAARPLQAARR